MTGDGHSLSTPVVVPVSPFSGGRRLEHHVGHLLEQAALFERAEARNGRPTGAVAYHDVTSEVDGVVVLDRLTLAVPSGRRTAIVGLTGPGKGAFVDQILGRWWPRDGDVVVFGQSTRMLHSEEDQVALGRRIGVVLRDGGLFSSWSIYDNVAVLLRNDLGAQETEIEPLVNEILGEVGLAAQAALLPESLAAGHRKRGGLARALVARPELVIVDELEAGVDAQRAQLLAELVLHLHHRRGGTFLSLTQDIHAARLTADELILVNRGRLVAAGPPAELARSANPHVRELLVL